MSAEGRFLDVVPADPTVAAVLERAPALGAGDWRRTPVLPVPDTRGPRPCTRAGPGCGYGYDDLFGLVPLPNPRSPAPRQVYEAKAGPLDQRLSRAGEG